MFTRAVPEPDSVRAYGSEPDQVLELFGTTGPVIAVIHGGYWRPEYDRTHVRPLADALARTLGARVANVEYRRIPGDPDASIDDVTAAIAHLHAREQSSVLLVGHSAGGQLALCAHARSPLDARGVVALAPVTDLVMAHELELDEGAVADFLGCAAQARPDLDPGRLAMSMSDTGEDEQSPQRFISVIHGTDDIRVPIEMSRRFSPDTLIELPGIGHFELIDPQSAVFDVVLEEVRRGLLTPTA